MGNSLGEFALIGEIRVRVLLLYVSVFIRVYPWLKSFCKTIRAFADVFFLELRFAQKHVRADHQRAARQPARESSARKMPERGGNDVHQRHRDHEFPREVHELILAQARQRAAR